MSAPNGMVISSIGGCIGSIVSTTLKLGTLVRGISNAPTHIHRICTQAESCKAMALSLRILLMQMKEEGGDPVGLELIYVSNLENTLVGCQETLGLIETELQDLMKQNLKIGKDERARWIWREQEIGELLRRLEKHKSTLGLNLNILNCHQGQEMRKQMAEILNSIHSGQGSGSIGLATPVQPLRRLLSISNKNELLGPSLRAISENGDVETVQKLENNPEQDISPVTTPDQAKRTPQG